MALNDPIELAVILAFLAIFSILSYKKKLLDFEGIFIGNAVGLAAITYGPNPLVDFFAVVIFFVIGEIASNYPKRKHEERNIWNVLGNSLPALAMLILIIVFPAHSFLLELAFFGAISAALADTLSSEIGYYSKKTPIMITTFKKVAKGTDGGITKLGTAASFFGGTVIAIIYFVALLTGAPLPFYKITIYSIIVLFAGPFGSAIDSVFGALFETKKMLDKTQVNLIGSLSGAIFCIVLGLLI